MRIEDTDIHFLALFSERHDAVPVILLHGWPGKSICSNTCLFLHEDSRLEVLPELPLTLVYRLHPRISPAPLPHDPTVLTD